MVSILSNVNALAASRQLGVTKLGLSQAITRLTTGKRVNTAADDAASLGSGNTAQALARNLQASVVTSQVAYFAAQASDATYEEATNLAYRLSELEGGGNGATAEYTNVLAQIKNIGLADAVVTVSTTTGTGTSLSAATNSTTALTAIATARNSYASTMSTNQSSANLSGIKAENQSSIADAYLGADMGAEMANLTKFQIMMQAGTSALNNANQSSQTIMRLFQ